MIFCSPNIYYYYYYYYYSYYYYYYYYYDDDDFTKIKEDFEKFPSCRYKTAKLKSDSVENYTFI